MENKIIKIASEIFDCNITINSEMGNPEIWDSLGQLNLFMAIENDLNLNFSPEEVFKNNSIKKILESIQSKI